MSLVDSSAASQRQNAGRKQKHGVYHTFWPTPDTKPRTCDAVKDESDSDTCVKAAASTARDVNNVRKRYQNADQQEGCDRVHASDDAVAEAIYGINWKATSKRKHQAANEAAKRDDTQLFVHV
jgi:hypothetical protein